MDGYTSIVEKILAHPSIEVHLGKRFNPPLQSKEYDHVFWSGPLDAWFNYSQGRLGYRTLVFERFKAQGDYQGTAVINYCEEKMPYTRNSEHKHFAPWEQHENSICFQEYSKLTEGGDVPYYPLRLRKDKEILAKYIQLAEQEKNVTFMGRLGTYRYLDMHQVIGESLDLSKKCLTTNWDCEHWPSFSVRPL